MPKPPADFLQPLNAGDGVVGGADNPLVVLDHEVYYLVAGDVGHRVAEGAAKVFGDHAGASLADVLESLLLAVGQVHPHDDAPVLAVHGLAVFRGGLLSNLPQLHQGGAPDGVAGDAEGQHRRAVLPGSGDACGGLHRGHGHGDVRELVGAKLDDRLVKLEPVALVGDGIGLGHQAHDDAQRLVHHGPLVLGPDAQHEGVGGQRAGADAEDDPAAGEVVQLHEAVGDHVGMVIGKTDHAGAELDAAGALGRGGHEHFGRGDGLPSRAVVLADIGFIESQGVEPLNQFQIALQGLKWGSRPRGGTGP